MMFRCVIIINMVLLSRVQEVQAFNLLSNSTVLARLHFSRIAWKNIFSQNSYKWTTGSCFGHWSSKCRPKAKVVFVVVFGVYFFFLKIFIIFNTCTCTLCLIECAWKTHEYWLKYDLYRFALLRAYSKLHVNFQHHPTWILRFSVDIWHFIQTFSKDSIIVWFWFRATGEGFYPKRPSSQFIKVFLNIHINETLNFDKITSIQYKMNLIFMKPNWI